MNQRSSLDRRGFLAGILAACTAPAIVRSGLIMPIKPALITHTYEWKTLHSGVVISAQQFEESFFELFGKDAYGNEVVERLPHNPDLMMISSKNLATVEKISLVSPCKSPLPRTFHSVERTENLDESVVKYLRSRRT